MKDFRVLRVWEKSHQLVLDIYAISKNFPKNELFGLVSQIRRSAVSIPSNISEGCGRLSDAELAKFMVIASGSASELEYQLLLSKYLHFLSLDEYEKLANDLTEIHKMLNSFIKKLNTK
ncbi:four helix bundle protein [Dyadobacter flavalbus]|uniref:Four helix bundle protein n=2 Tax=Dyadobacter flavalbus TaxID=2579942 RepID=A0A5M8Q3P6_9BACT|nr:four helix bundle protein [Dyadobacter flavalbus]